MPDLYTPAQQRLVALLNDNGWTLNTAAKLTSRWSGEVIQDPLAFVRDDMYLFLTTASSGAVNGAELFQSDTPVPSLHRGYNYPANVQMGNRSLDVHRDAVDTLLGDRKPLREKIAWLAPDPKVAMWLLYEAEYHAVQKRIAARRYSNEAYLLSLEPAPLLDADDQERYTELLDEVRGVTNALSTGGGLFSHLELIEGLRAVLDEMEPLIDAQRDGERRARAEALLDKAPDEEARAAHQRRVERFRR